MSKEVLEENDDNAVAGGLLLTFPTHHRCVPSQEPLRHQPLAFWLLERRGYSSEGIFGASDLQILYRPLQKPSLSDTVTGTAHLGRQICCEFEVMRENVDVPTWRETRLVAEKISCVGEACI